MKNFRCCAALCALGLALACGCQTVPAYDTTEGTSFETPDGSATSASGAGTGVSRVARFLTGKEQINRDRAIALYREADALFREAMATEGDKAKELYGEAGDTFLRASEAHPASALEQDALFMAGESYFFSDQLTRAEDAYVQLQKSHPRNRHSSRVGSRLFSIAQYWIETDKNPRPQILPVNLTDDSRPLMDPSGHGIRVLDQMRYDDPTGKLADDATMAAAYEHLRNENFFEADQMLTDLREIYPDSSHQFMAFKLGITCKLQMYAGAAYSGLVLEEANELIEQMRLQFPNELADPENRDFVAKAAAEVRFRQAEKLWARAQYREKQGYYGGANVYLQELLEQYPDTPFADQARESLAENSERPPMPPQRLAFLAKLFPEGEPQKPLMTTDGKILRR